MGPITVLLTAQITTYLPKTVTVLLCSLPPPSIRNLRLYARIKPQAHTRRSYAIL